MLPCEPAYPMANLNTHSKKNWMQIPFTIFHLFFCWAILTKTTRKRYDRTKVDVYLKQHKIKYRQKRSHSVYDDSMREFSGLFEVWADKCKPVGTLSGLQKITGIPYGTILNWKMREKALQNHRSWRHFLTNTNFGWTTVNQDGQQKKLPLNIFVNCIEGMQTTTSFHCCGMSIQRTGHQISRNMLKTTASQLQFIASGQTDKWQPLDFRIFGSLKSRANALFSRMNVVRPNGNDASVNWQLAVIILVLFLYEIPTNEVLNAWSQIDLDVKEYLANE